MACLPVFITGREIARWEGALFLAYYMAYVAWLVLAAQHNGLLGTYSTVMMSFVLPLTLVTLVVMLIRREPHQ
jgi:cation:H+ antiporter